MLSQVIHRVVSARRTDARGVLSRAPGRMLSARTVGEVRERLASLVAALYGRELRLELFVVGGNAELVPARPSPAVDQLRARQLLAMVRSRLHAARLSPDEAHALSADELPGRRPVLTAPLPGASGEPLGVVIVEGDSADPDFTQLELVALEGAAALASGALQRIEADRLDASWERRELDRASARRIQRGFLSSALPAGIGVAVRAEYLPAFDVGGDFYSFQHLADDTVNVTIGDVSGNGVAAALVMSRIASELERAVATGAAPARALAAANEQFARSEPEVFVTAACVRIDRSRRRLTVANAGHLPLVVRRASGEVLSFGGASGLPLGVAASDYAEEDFFLEPRDILLLMTDGLLEALDHPSGHRGLEFLIDCVREAPHDPDAVHEQLRTLVDQARLEHRLDDVTWVGVQVTA